MKFLLKSGIVLLFFLNTSVLQSQSFIPTDISGLVLWVKGDSVHLNGSTIDTSFDCSGNNNHAIQATPLNQPLWVDDVINGEPVMRFNGNDDFFSISNLTLTSFSFFTIFKKDTDANSGALLGRNSAIDQLINWVNGVTYFGNSVFQAYSTGNILDYSILNIVFNGTSGTCYLNGTSVGNSAGDPSSSFNEIGATLFSGRYLSGDIAEMIIYDQVLNTTDREAVEDYLRNKYAPHVSLGADIVIPYGFCDTTLDAGGSFDTYLWNTGETSSSITVDTGGTYWVFVTDIFGDTSSDAVNVSYPAINLNDTLFCSGSSVTLSTGLVGSYDYSWSGGQTTSTINVSTPGDYWVTITDDSSCVKITDTITVTEDDFPSTASLWPDTNLCAGNAIGLVSPDPLPPGLIYSWSTTATTATINIPATATYGVTVTNSNNCIATDDIDVTIAGTAPTVDFHHTPACSGDTVQFTNDSSPSGDAWLWDFDDGDTSNQENPSHIFTAGDSYNVKLTVYDGICSNYLVKAVVIPASPAAYFNSGTACISSPYQFNDQSIIYGGDSINSWDWDFGDLSPHSSLQNPVHTYGTINTYNVTLTIQTDNGCQSDTTGTVNVVNSAPVPSYFTLYQPGNNSFSSENTINFAWNASSNATEYTLEYSDNQNFTGITTRITSLTNTYYSGYISPSQKYYWRVIAYGICKEDSIFSDVFSFTIISLDNTDMKLWLKADSAYSKDVNDFVSAWNDCSGDNNHATQVTQLNKPLWVDSIKLLNNKPVMRFYGDNKFFVIPDITLSSFSFFAIFKKDISTNSGALLGRNSAVDQLINWADGNTYFGNTAFQTCNTGHILTYSILNINFNGASGTCYLNGASVVSSGGDASNLFNEIGATLFSGRYLSGDIAEMIIYDDNLNDSLCNLVEQYLRYKYAPPVNLGPDITVPYGFCDTTLDAGDRFTDYIWSTGETTSSIDVINGGTYSVTVTDIFDDTSSDAIYVNKPSLDLDNDTMCMGIGLTINPGLDNNYDFLWSDALDDSLSTDSFFQTSSAGTYWLKVLDTLDCSVTDTFETVIDSFEVTASLGPDRGMCSGESLVLTAGGAEASDYQWSDGSSNSSYLISIPETISVTVTNVRGCTARDTVIVTIKGQQPIVDFTAAPVCFGNPTLFFDNSGGATINSWTWDFDDTHSDTIEDPSHTYATADTFDVSLTVGTTDGCTNSKNKDVIVYSLPVADFSPTNGCENVEIQFTDKSTDQSGDIDTWQWDFGDDSISADANPIHTYDTAGLYTVNLVATTEFGCKDTVSKTMNVRNAPVPYFSCTTPCLGEVTYFIDSVITQSWNPVMEWNWDFGDGSDTSKNNPGHNYSNTGIYHVSLTVTSLNECSVTAGKDIYVESIDPGFIISGDVLDDLCANTSYTFFDTSLVVNDSIVEWTWDFGGLSASTDSSPGFAFSDPGTYKIVLTVESSAGCVNNIEQNVDVHDVPEAAFSFDPEYGTPPLTVDFTNLTDNAVSYKWYFGNGDSSAAINPLYIYADSGIYNIVLIAVNSDGCIDTALEQINVLHTIVDVAVVKVNRNLQGEYLSPDADIVNLGTRRIEELYISAKKNDGPYVAEYWTGTLDIGDTLHYDFTALFENGSGLSSDYLCVKASIPGIEVDNNPSNDEECITFNNNFLALDPYPNPSHSELFIDFILPAEDNVDVFLYDAKGSKISTLYSGTGKKGLNRIEVNLNGLSMGSYNYIIYFQDKQQVKRFVKY